MKEENIHHLMIGARTHRPFSLSLLFVPTYSMPNGNATTGGSTIEKAISPMSISKTGRVLCFLQLEIPIQREEVVWHISKWRQP